MSDDTERSEPMIKVQPDGPYLVSGAVPVRRKEIIASELGESLTWKTGEALEERATYALCRCGGSSSKPYCDGTHKTIGFDGTETAATDTYTERASTIEGTGIDVHDDRPLCVHAGFCGNKTSNVWKMTPKTDDTVVRSQVMAMVERCPSGALTYEVEGDTIEPDLPVEVAIMPDGPLWVTGGIPVQRSDGEPMETRNRVTLCRCGHSANKPLCDGSHADHDFKG